MPMIDDTIASLYSPRARNAPTASNVPPAFPVTVNFDQGLPDPALFPVDLLKRYLVETLDVDGAEALKYFGGDHADDMRYGYVGLRQRLAARIAARDGRDIDAAGVALVNGSTDGLALAVNAFVGPGDGAVVEAATYPHTRNFLIAAGATLRTVPLDDQGMVVDALPEVLDAMQADGVRPKMIYTIPTFHAPTGTVLPRSRRERLVEIAQQRGVMVLEDNCYYEFGYDAPPPPTLLALDHSGLVLQSDSFSKYVAPGLRMAWIAGAPIAVEAVVRVRQDFAVSQLLARAMERYVSDGQLDAHLAQLRDAYRHKRDVTAAALRKHCEPWVRFRPPDGGFYFWIELSDQIDWDGARERMAERGIAFRPGTQFVHDESGRRYVRISCIQVPEADIEPGIAALGAALAAAARA